ncbi:hypothetical protein VF21_09249 [Pseudogymnoascus sp. 05NY08]|nr:hypothetical protein VF21_09249 [Pseudogymnoascus sp. 05NY08]
MVGKGLLSYRCVFETANGRAIGALIGDVSDINISATCYADDDLQGHLTFNINFACPEHMKKTDDIFQVDVHLYGVNVNKIDVSDVEDPSSVSQSVSDTPGFDERASSRLGVVKAVLDIAHVGITTTNLFHRLKFENYIGQQKPWINQAMDDIRRIFSTNGILTFYVRNEKTHFSESVNSLLDRFSEDDATGTTIRRFYPKKFHGPGTRMPHFSLNELNETLPVVKTKPVKSHTNLLDFITRKAMSYVQMSDEVKKQVDKFNGLLHYTKLLDSPGSGNIYYYAQFHMNDEDSELKLRLKPGDVIHFQFNTGPNPMEPTWRGVVLKNPAWMETGRVALKIIRPKISEDSCEAEAIDTKKRPRVVTALPCGDGSGNDAAQYKKMQDAPLVPVRCDLEFSDMSKKRVVNANHILSRQAKQAPNVLDKDSPWINNDHLRKLGQRLLNQSAIPETTFNLIGRVKHLLNNVTEEDHRTVINYLEEIPVLNGLALGIITGRAGSGKTRFMSIIIVALLAYDMSLPVADRFMRFLLVAPSNEPVDVFIEKILDEVSKHPDLQGEIFIRGHNVNTESSFVDAFMENEAKKTTASGPSSEVKDKINITTAIVKSALSPNDFVSIENLVTTREMERYSGAAKIIFNTKILTFYPSTTTDSILELFSLVKLKDCITALDGKDPTPPTPLPAANEDTNPKIIVDESMLLDNGMVNMDLADTLNAKVMAEQINASMSRGASLISDPRFIKVKQSIGFTVLAICGLAKPTNNYTDLDRWSSLNALLTRLMEDGDNFSSLDKSLLKEQMTEMRNYILSIAKVVATTPMNACSAPFYNAFRPTVIVGDEMNRSLLPEFASVWVHYEAPTVILLGDLKQLSPVVTGPMEGFVPELEMSTLRYFASNYYTKGEIHTQRRSRKGIMDIATTRYYKSETMNGPHATSDIAHPCTAPMLAVLQSIIPTITNEQISSPAIYLETHGAVTIKDAMTDSAYNLSYSALGVNLVEKAVASGMDPKSFGVITPYNAQNHVYVHAFRKLHEEFPTAGYNHVLVGTTDSMEGSEAPVIIFDSGVSHRIGFTNDRGRCLVNLTRAKDACIVIAQPSTLEKQKHVKAEIRELYKLAQQQRIVRNLLEGNDLFTHRYVVARVQMNKSNLMEIDAAQNLHDNLPDDYGDNSDYEDKSSKKNSKNNTKEDDGGFGGFDGFDNNFGDAAANNSKQNDGGFGGFDGFDTNFGDAPAEPISSPDNSNSGDTPAPAESVPSQSASIDKSGVTTDSAMYSGPVDKHGYPMDFSQWSSVLPQTTNKRISKGKEPEGKRQRSTD